MSALPSPSDTPVLSLADLETFDPRAPQGGVERRFLCPLCGDTKPKDAAHRSLTLNAQSGAWQCFRCGARGKLREMWDERPLLPRRERAQRALRSAFSLQATSDTVSAQNGPERAGKAPCAASLEWRVACRGLEKLHGTRGEAYLRGRGVSVETAHASGARFSPGFFGRPAVVFPLRDQSGALVGAQGRSVDGRDRPKARTVGDKKVGLFASAGALDPQLPALIVTEAPLDALSLAEVGYPAVALCGTEPPAWMHRLCAFRRVLLAFDADEAGERAGEKLAPVLTSFGARCERLQPEGAKDWNEMLQTRGRDALADWLAWRVLRME